MELKELEFKPSDFRLKRNYHDKTWDYENILENIAAEANKILAAKLEKLEDIQCHECDADIATTCTECVENIVSRAMAKLYKPSGPVVL